ncbi:MAG: cytochrome b [Bosea sp.]|nr:cytochrome b [Bosea sp. (in: a-proteobacteria)]
MRNKSVILGQLAFRDKRAITELDTWSVGVRVLHWLTVAALAVQIATAFAVMGGLGMTTMLWLPWHSSLGIAILAIVFVRIGWRLAAKDPVRPRSPVLAIIGALVQICLYALIVAIVITGWLAYRPLPLMPPPRVFGVWQLPAGPHIGAWTARDLTGVHRSLVWAFLAFLGVHVAGGAWHALVLRDRVFDGMLFSRARGTSSERPDRSSPLVEGAADDPPSP